MNLGCSGMKPGADSICPSAYFICTMNSADQGPATQLFTRPFGKAALKLQVAWQPLRDITALPAGSHVLTGPHNSAGQTRCCRFSRGCLCRHAVARGVGRVREWEKEGKCVQESEGLAEKSIIKIISSV